MMLAFAEDIKNMGNLPVWWCAIREVLTVALPGQRSNRSVIVPALSFGLCALIQSAELWIGSHQAARVAYPPLPEAISLVILPSLLNGFVAFVVTRFYARCSFITLRLD
jgi:hypothetical protein